jgi:hypothetical protein
MEYKKIDDPSRADFSERRRCCLTKLLSQGRKKQVERPKVEKTMSTTPVLGCTASGDLKIQDLRSKIADSHIGTI